MARYLVSRVRHVVEAISIDASSPEEAIDKARQTKRAEWSHIESKRRRGYKADAIDVNTSRSTR